MVQSLLRKQEIVLEFTDLDHGIDEGDEPLNHASGLKFRGRKEIESIQVEATTPKERLTMDDIGEDGMNGIIENVQFVEVMDYLEHSQNFNLGYIGPSHAIYDLKPVGDLFKLPYEKIYLQWEEGNSFFAILASQYEDQVDTKVILLERRLDVPPEEGWPEWSIIDGCYLDVDDDGILRKTELITEKEFDLITAKDEMADLILYRNPTSEPYYMLFACFLSAINCENVQTIDIPAPKHMNKKRKAKGRFEFDGYKQLVINLPRGQRENVTGKRPTGGSHRSPRMHMRRGHIRRLKSGKHTWVRSTIIGMEASNTIEKEYLVRVK